MNVLETLRDGYARAGSPTGVALTGLAFLFQLASTVGLQSQPAEATAALREQFPELAPPADGPLALPLSAGGASALSLLATLGTVAVFVVGFRLLSTDGVPAPGTVTRNLGRAILHGLAGYLLLLVLLAVGTALFVLPGLFALVSFAFFVGFVALEDEGVVSAYRHSWELAGGRRLRIGLLFLGLALAALLFTAVAGMALSPLLGVSELGWWLGNVAASAVVLVYAVAVLSAGFERLRDDAATAEADDEFADIDDELLP
ncbi:hypothetical protein [Halostella litorea]|uniref:hypothetical protein n=1 Tax=Halostella litorea TaxID=2528831 RepID=UPI0010928531|nr:hypothetical protein [Halostella litorea]